jgi:hypothetical protein
MLLAQDLELVDEVVVKVLDDIDMCLEGRTGKPMGTSYRKMPICLDEAHERSGRVDNCKELGFGGNIHAHA